MQNDKEMRRGFLFCKIINHIQSNMADYSIMLLLASSRY